MCGIAGIVNTNRQPVSLDILKRMNDDISHRGPDGDGFFCEGNVGLAHRRLAIIDPRGGIQPFYNDDRSIVLSFNGEVYNFVEIRRALENEYHFQTHSDTEVVLRAYEKWGIEALQHFRGMFAFALYDQKKGLLYIVRDRVGIKPLFYYQSADQLIFASEILPILTAGMPRTIRPESLANYLRYQYVPAPATIYENLHKLEPGHYLEINTHTGAVEKRCFWKLVVDIVNRTEGEWLEELNAVLDETMRIYIRSDVPFGAFLSGGVDSSIVTALMAQHLDHPVRTFSIGFDEQRHSELPYAAQVSRVVKTNHYEKNVSPQLAEHILSSIARHFGEPFGDSSAIPTYYVSREAASQVKMVLSGDGGDELFGGYNSYQTTFRDFSQAGNNLMRSVYYYLARRFRISRPGGQALPGHIAPHQQRHDAQRQAFDDGRLLEILSPDIPVPPSEAFVADVRTSNIDPVTWFQAQDFKTYMVDDVLTKVDRMSMANSLEVRVPLLDHKVVELAFSLPLALKLRQQADSNHLITKYLLKKSAERFFSPDFLERPKQGFGIPIVEWCRGPIRPLIEAGLRDAQNPIFDWVQFRSVQSLLDQFFAGHDGLVARLWYLFSLDLWGQYVHRPS
jgi:asparagine synthase (glutamine-hydrolysing)